MAEAMMPYLVVMPWLILIGVVVAGLQWLLRHTQNKMARFSLAALIGAILYGAFLGLLWVMQINGPSLFRAGMGLMPTFLLLSAGGFIVAVPWIVLALVFDEHQRVR